MKSTNLIDRLRDLPRLDDCDEAAALIEQQEAVIASLIGALKNADQFMTNGIEIGYIRLPTAPDSALLTPGIVRSAILAAKTHLGE